MCVCSSHVHLHKCHVLTSRSSSQFEWRFCPKIWSNIHFGKVALMPSFTWGKTLFHTLYESNSITKVSSSFLTFNLWIFHFGPKFFCMLVLKVFYCVSSLSVLCSPRPFLCFSDVKMAAGSVPWHFHCWYLSLDFPFKERVEPEYEVPGENSLRPACKLTVTSVWTQTLGLDLSVNSSQSLISFLQNKVLAVIDAIEAAQYLISHNATHLISKVIKESSPCS